MKYLRSLILFLVSIRLRLHGTGRIWIRYEIRTVEFCLHCTVFILIPSFLRLHGTDIYTLVHAQNSCRENSKWLPATKKGNLPDNLIQNQSEMREKRTLAGLIKRWPFFYKSS